MGDHFTFDLEKAKANPECIFQGNKYRISVLTERLIRLEYSENGIFNDNPTEFAWYRNFSKPQFSMQETNTQIRIASKYFELIYTKEKPFYGGKISPTKNLRVNLKNTEKVWYYNHPEVRNYQASTSNPEKNKNAQKSLYSLDGFVSFDDSKSLLILQDGTYKTRESEQIDTYLFIYNKDFYFCLDDYFKLTGYPPLIPKYALGIWWDKDDFYNEIDVARIIKKFEENNVPVSLFTLNNWQENNNFAFSNLYTNPSSIVAYLKSKNIKVGLAINDPIIFEQTNRNYETLKQYLVPDKNGNIPFNLLDARTIDSFLKLIIYPLSSMGIDYFSIENFDKNNLKRLYLLKHYLYYDNLKNPIKRPLISSQSAMIASHRYPILYAGKSTVGWQSLKNIPMFNSSASNLGISFWSHDFGGTSDGVEDNELYTRYIQLGTFSPIFRIGADSGKYYKREPWKWGIKTGLITTNYMNLRYKLIPYIYTESYKYHKHGKPLIEPIYYRYPILIDDVNYRNEYFFGSSFFISPILEKKDYIMNRVIHKLFIPEGIWYDYFDGKKYIGNKKYVSFYKDEEYPVFVKAGSIIPLSTNNFNDVSNPQTMELQIFPGMSNTYSIYEDDGETNNYQNGDYLITNVEYIHEKNNYRVTILPVDGKAGVVPKTRNYKIVFKNTNPAAKVLSYIGGQQVANTNYKEGTNLVIEIKDVPTISQLTVVVSGEKLEIDAIRIINEDIVSIISDLPIKTVVKQKIDDIMFSKEYNIKKKRIEIRKLAHGKNYLEKKYIELFLKLLEYIGEV